MLVGSELVLSWFESDSVTEFGFNCQQFTHADEQVQLLLPVSAATEVCLSETM